jgi:prevent-host-death family protein
MPEISMTNLRRNFDEIVEQVAAGQVFIITKRGKPLCRFQPVDEHMLAEFASLRPQQASRP